MRISTAVHPDEYCRSAPPLNEFPPAPVTLALPCSPENEEVPHGEKDQGQGGPEAEVGERSVAERDRPHRPRLEAQRPGRAGGREGGRGVSWEDVEGMSEEAVYALLFPGRGDAGPAYADPGWARVHRELAKTSVALKLLHAEYADGCAEAGAPSMSYDRFCKRHRQYTVSRNVVGRVGHKAGRNMDVDCSGSTMRLVDVAQGPQEAAGHTQVDRARRLQREGRGGEQQDQGGNQAGLRLSEHRQPDRPHHVKVLGPEAGPAGAGGVGFYPHELTKPLFNVSAGII